MNVFVLFCYAVAIGCWVAIPFVIHKQVRNGSF